MTIYTGEITPADVLEFSIGIDNLSTLAKAKMFYYDPFDIGYKLKSISLHEKNSNNYKAFLFYEKQITTLRKKVFGSIKKPIVSAQEEIDKAYSETALIGKEIKKIPIDFDKENDTNYQHMEKYPAIYNLYFDITNDAGLKCCQPLRNILKKSLTGADKTQKTIYNILKGFTALYQNELTPKEKTIPNHIKAALFNLVKKQVTEALDFALLFRIFAAVTAGTREGLITEDQQMKFWEEAKDAAINPNTLLEYISQNDIKLPQKNDQYIKEGQKEIASVTKKLEALKNPFTQKPKPQILSDTRTPTDRVVLDALCASEATITGKIQGLSYCLDHITPLNRTTLFNLLLIGNSYLRKEYTLDISRAAPLLIPVKEIMTAKNGGIVSKIKSREYEAFDEAIRDIVTRRIKFSIKYTDETHSKKDISLLDNYRFIPEETYLLQADTIRDEKTKERYLSITAPCMFFEVVKKNHWHAPIPFVFYSDPLKKALKKSQLHEETKALAFLLFTYLTANIDSIAKHHKQSTSLKLWYSDLYSFCNPSQGKYEDLDRTEKQRFRDEISKTLNAFVIIADTTKKEENTNYYKAHPFLQLLKEGKYKALYNGNIVTGIELAQSEKYRNLLAAKIKNDRKNRPLKKKN